MSNFRIVMASLPDRDEEVAEVFSDNRLWAEVNQEIAGQFRIEFYNHPENQCWDFSYEEAMDALEKAKNKLASMKKIENEDYRKLGLDD